MKHFEPCENFNIFLWRKVLSIAVDFVFSFFADYLLPAHRAQFGKPCSSSKEIVCGGTVFSGLILLYKYLDISTTFLQRLTLSRLKTSIWVYIPKLMTKGVSGCSQWRIRQSPVLLCRYFSSQAWFLSSHFLLHRVFFNSACLPGSFPTAPDGVCIRFRLTLRGSCHVPCTEYPLLAFTGMCRWKKEKKYGLN